MATVTVGSPSPPVQQNQALYIDSLMGFSQKKLMSVTTTPTRMYFMQSDKTLELKITRF